MIKELIVKPDMSVREAVNYVDIEQDKIICIVDSEQKLLGIFTAGDLRRYALTSGDMSEKIGNVMNTKPIVFFDKAEAEKHINNGELVGAPIVDQKGRLIDISLTPTNSNMIVNHSLKDVPLVMMAGGKGTRLYPYTKVLPKALFPIGNLTISERIINNFMKYGCENVHFILNYKAGMIRAYYQELRKNYKTDFVEEEMFLGTGGGLKLLENQLNSTFIVTNCDILVNADFECALKTHKENKNIMTFVCAMKDLEIPYGVIDTNKNGEVQNIVEKPSVSFLTNTGVYIIEPEIFSFIKENEFIHLPDIARRCMENGFKVGVFPVSNKAWLDMGQFNEMEKMLKELEVREVDHA